MMMRSGLSGSFPSEARTESGPTLLAMWLWHWMPSASSVRRMTLTPVSDELTTTACRSMKVLPPSTSTCS